MTARASRFLKASLVVAAMLVVQACFEGPESNPPRLPSLHPGICLCASRFHCRPASAGPSALRTGVPAPGTGMGCPPGCGRVFGFTAYRCPSLPVDDQDAVRPPRRRSRRESPPPALIRVASIASSASAWALVLA